MDSVDVTMPSYKEVDLVCPHQAQHEDGEPGYITIAVYGRTSGYAVVAVAGGGLPRLQIGTLPSHAHDWLYLDEDIASELIRCEECGYSSDELEEWLPSV